MLLPRFHSIVRDGEQITLAAQCCQQHLVYAGHFDHKMLRKCAEFNDLRSSSGGVLFEGYPPPFHRDSTGYPQLFTQAFAGVFRVFSTLFPHLLHILFDSFSVQHSRSFFLSLYDAFPHDLTSSAGRKKGVKEAQSRICGKLPFFDVRWIRKRHEPACAHVLWHVEQSEAAARTGTTERSATRFDAGFGGRLASVARGRG